ncbi:hypothetical protein D3C71_1943480 [compost metagenome]
MALDLGDEQIVGIETCQLDHHAGDGVRLAEQGCAQRGAETFTDRDAGEQAQIFRLKAHQHFTFEIVGKPDRIANLYPVKARHLFGFEINRKQL